MEDRYIYIGVAVLVILLASALGYIGAFQKPETTDQAVYQKVYQITNQMESSEVEPLPYGAMGKIPPGMTIEEYMKIITEANMPKDLSQLPEYGYGWERCLMLVIGLPCSYMSESCNPCFAGEEPSNCYLTPNGVSGFEDDACIGMTSEECCEVGKSKYADSSASMTCYCKTPTETCADGKPIGYGTCLDTGMKHTLENGQEVIVPVSMKCSVGGVYKVETCYAGGCANGECYDICDECGTGEACRIDPVYGMNICMKCTSNWEKDCYENDVYWFDFCGRKESLSESCASYEQCKDGVCIGYVPPPEPPGVWGWLAEVWTDFINWLAGLFGLSQEVPVVMAFDKGTEITGSVTLDTSGLVVDTDYSDGTVDYIKKCIVRLPKKETNLDKYLFRLCTDLGETLDGKIDYGFTLDVEQDVHFILTEQKGTYDFDLKEWDWETAILKERSKLIEYRFEITPPEPPGVWDWLVEAWTNFINWLFGIFGG